MEAIDFVFIVIIFITLKNSHELKKIQPSKLKTVEASGIVVVIIVVTLVVIDVVVTFIIVITLEPS